LSDGRRFIANTPQDASLLRDMTERDYLDAPGKVTHAEGVNLFQPD
jgi:acetyl-CoA C-acetyltransferase